MKRVVSSIVLVLLLSLLLVPETRAASKEAGPGEESIYERPIQQEIGWVRNRTHLVYGFRNMYQPCVIEIPDKEYPYRMWFFGWATEDTNPDQPGCDAIYFGRSKDLETWEIFMGKDTWDTEMRPDTWAPVLTASDRYYDAWHNGDPSVVYHEGRYYMAYSATSVSYYKKSHDHLDGQLLCIMGALSEDGIHWTKTEQPLLIEREEAQQAANTDEHVCDFHRPSLMFEDGVWRLWFDYWNHPHGVCMGYAENTGAFDLPGGFRVQHDLRAEPLIKNWPNPEVVKVGDVYYAFADPAGYPPTDAADVSSRMWSSRQLCEAVSKDGRTWRILGYLPPDEDTPACHVAQALLTTIQGERRLYLFYATQRGGGPPYDYRYNAIRAMYRAE